MSSGWRAWCGYLLVGLQLALISRGPRENRLTAATTRSKHPQPGPTWTSKLLSLALQALKRAALRRVFRNPDSDGCAAEGFEMKVKIRKWNAVATWRWDIPDDDVCGICQVHFDGTCPTCKYPGDDCSLRMLFRSSSVLLAADQFE